jgi:outer membrane lipoprotein
MRYFILLSLLLLLSGCVTVISNQIRPLIDKQVNYAAVQSAPDAYLGKYLLVGGKIVASTSSNELSSLELQQFEVDADGFPVDLTTFGGRFIAESTAYYDPALHKPGSLVTLVGEVRGKRSQMLDGKPYFFPVLTIKELYLWDPDKFGGRKQNLDINPYAYTHDQPMVERPLTPLIIKR